MWTLPKATATIETRIENDAEDEERESHSRARQMRVGEIGQGEVRRIRRCLIAGALILRTPQRSYKTEAESRDAPEPACGVRERFGMNQRASSSRVCTMRGPGCSVGSSG